MAIHLTTLKTQRETLKSQTPDENEQQVATELESESEAYGPAYSRGDRWEKVDSWLLSQATQLINTLKREAQRETGSVSQDDLDVLDVLMAFDDEGDGSQSLTSQIGNLRREIAYLKQAKEFKESIARALASLNEVDLRAVMEAKEELVRDFPGRVDPALWKTYQEELQRTLIKKTQKTTPDVIPPPKPKAELLSLPELPLRNYTAFHLDRQIRRVDTDDNKTLFVRAEDLCFALAQETGKPRWVCRVGYDARWL
ncbi:MAG: hypothetical protein KDA84_09485, partial [Planctomycetaceae bacterium]|nr:hypothetical protein [Planctomycetaceae bacterium]